MFLYVLLACLRALVLALVQVRHVPRQVVVPLGVAHVLFARNTYVVD